MGRGSRRGQVDEIARRRLCSYRFGGERASAGREGRGRGRGEREGGRERKREEKKKEVAREKAGGVKCHQSPVTGTSLGDESRGTRNKRKTAVYSDDECSDVEMNCNHMT